MHKMDKTDNHYQESIHKERKQGILTNPTFQSILIGGLVSFIGLLLIWVFTHFDNRIDRLDNKIDNVRLEMKQDINKLEAKIDNMQKENNEFFKLILLELKKK